MLSDYFREFLSKVKAGDKLESLINDMRAMKMDGLGRKEMLQLLRSLRQEAGDESVEDRILELMDVACGFCSQQNKVWDD